MSTDHKHYLTLTIPFPSCREAEIAYKAISPDPELKPDQFTQQLRHGPAAGEGGRSGELVAEFAAASDRVLRVGVNGFMASLGVVVGCLAELDEI
ncbi:CTAG/Pcc1 family [Limtongia smithiae]|uniref:CTAG/Pcc1 family n=1 Tax=Limtongia smithiae TaxID=1125753 RepID=UPI0034CD1057